MSEPRIDVEKVAEALRELGIRAGDMVGLHSRVPSLGRIIVEIFKRGGDKAVEQAANDIIDAFVAAVGPSQGTVCVPTFSYCFVGREGSGAFNPDTSPSHVGMLTGVFLHRPDSVRSLHPTHSVAAIGARAEELVRGHENVPALGEDSPFHRLAQWGGWLCYFGTNGNTLSLLHVAEAVARVPYLKVFRYEYCGWKNAALIERSDGKVEEVPLEQTPGCSKHFHRFDPLAEKAGIMRTTQIYGSRVVLFKAKDALNLAVEKLREDPGCLLCPKGECQACDAAWAAME